MGISRKVSTVVAAAGLAGIVYSFSYVGDIKYHADALRQASPPVVQEYLALEQRLQETEERILALPDLQPEDIIQKRERLQRYQQLRDTYHLVQQRLESLQEVPAVKKFKNHHDKIFNPSLWYLYSGIVASVFCFVGGMAAVVNSRKNAARNAGSSPLPEGRSVPTEPLRRG